jgi:hypothetical protein
MLLRLLRIARSQKKGEKEKGTGYHSGKVVPSPSPAPPSSLPLLAVVALAVALRRVRLAGLRVAGLRLRRVGVGPGVIFLSAGVPAPPPYDNMAFAPGDAVLARQAEGVREDLATIEAVEPCGGFTVRWASSSLTQLLAPGLLQPLPSRSRARPAPAAAATPAPKPAKKRARAAEDAPLQPVKASRVSKAATTAAAAAAAATSATGAAASATGAAAASAKPAKAKAARKTSEPAAKAARKASKPAAKAAREKASGVSGAKGGSAGAGGGGGAVSAAAARSEARAAECCICLAGSPDVSTLCCGVPVHNACLTQWLASSSNSNCVQCRSALPRPSAPPPAPAPAPRITLRTVVDFGRYNGCTVQTMLQDASYVAWMTREAPRLTPPLSDIYAFYLSGSYRAQRAAEARADEARAAAARAAAARAEELASAERARARVQLQEEEARRRAALEARQREAGAGGQQYAAQSAAQVRSALGPASGGGASSTTARLWACTARGCKGSRKGQCKKRLCCLCCSKYDPSPCVTHKVQGDPRRAPTPQ